MANKVLAMTTDGKLTYCTASPENRGKGRCNHIGHQEPGESIEEFVIKCSSMMNIDNSRTTQEIINDLIRENSYSYDADPDWNAYVSPLIYKYLTLGDEHCEGGCDVTQEYNEYGDEVDHLILKIKFRGEEYECDFGQIPHVQENGTFTIKGTDYRCLPVVGRNKVGYGQGYNADGEKSIWLYQKDGNLGITIPVEGDKVKILGKFYNKEDIEKAIIEGKSDDPKVDSIIKSLDERTKLRFPEFGKEGWMSKMTENFKKDEVNDLSWRKVYTFEDQVGEELESQMRRMGVTFRKNLSSEDGKSNGKIVFFQDKNTNNIISNLQNRSNVHIAENINPLASYSQYRKISLVGREGYNKDKCPDNLRYPSESYKGITDPMDQSSGKSIGLNVFLKNAEIKNGTIIKTEGTDNLSLTDFVPFRNHNNPNRVSMATSQMRQAMILKDGQDPKKLGDPRSDRAWASISGAKMGINARTVLLTGEQEWEDSCRISESFAKKLTAIKTFNYSEDPKYKDGDVIKPGDIIAGTEVKFGGTLKRKPGGKGFTMEAEVPFRTGDKLAGRYGDKNTAGKIIPDDQMPKIYDKELGKYVPADIVRSPLSTGKRGNIGVPIEIQREYRNNGEINLSTKDITPVLMPNGKTVKANNGEMFIMRLNQISKEKEHHTDGKLQKDMEFHSRFGEMESILMTTTADRRNILKYLRGQGLDESARLDDVLKSFGVARK